MAMPRRSSRIWRAISCVFALELNRIDDAVIDRALETDTLAAHYKPWLVDLRMDKPYQLDDKIEQLFLEKSMTGASAFQPAVR